MSAGNDHDLLNALAVIADAVYDVDLYALSDRCQSSMKQQIASHHGELLAAMVTADASFQIAVELGRLAEALAEGPGKAVRK